MGSVRIPLGAAVGAAALIFVCGPAAAATPASSGPERQAAVRLAPAAIAPGGDLDIRTRSCGGAISGTAGSAAFVSPVRLAPAAEGGLFAQAVVRSTAKSGSYPVVVNCDGAPRVAEGRLTVSGPGKQWEPEPRDQGQGREKQQGNQWEQPKSQGGGQGKQQDSHWEQPNSSSGGRQQGEDPANSLEQNSQWGQDSLWGQDSQWGQGGAGPYAPVPAGGGGTARLVKNTTAGDRQPPETGVPGVVTAGVLTVAGAAGLALHRRRRHGDQD